MIGGGLLVLFVVIGRVITRDARKTLRASGRDAPQGPRDQGPHKHARQAKAKARAKTKAQRRARRAEPLVRPYHSVRARAAAHRARSSSSSGRSKPANVARPR